jgi:hypothetical protein
MTLSDFIDPYFAKCIIELGYLQNRIPYLEDNWKPNYNFLYCKCSFLEKDHDKVNVANLSQFENANFQKDFVKLYFLWKSYGAGLTTIGFAGAGE